MQFIERFSEYRGFGLERFSEYRGFGLERFSEYRGFGLERFHCILKIALCFMSDTTKYCMLGESQNRNSHIVSV